MTLKKYKQIFEALDNERRLELFEYILKKIFISKSELAKKFDLSRASLNHHLNIMLKAGLLFENMAWRTLFLPYICRKSTGRPQRCMLVGNAGHGKGRIHESGRGNIESRVFCKKGDQRNTGSLYPG